MKWYSTNWKASNLCKITITPAVHSHRLIQARRVPCVHPTANICKWMRVIMDVQYFMKSSASSDLFYFMIIVASFNPGELGQKWAHFIILHHMYGSPLATTSITIWLSAFKLCKLNNMQHYAASDQLQTASTCFQEWYSSRRSIQSDKEHVEILCQSLQVNRLIFFASCRLRNRLWRGVLMIWQRYKTRSDPGHPQH